METPTYLSQLKVNKAQLEAKISKFTNSGDPEQAAHLPRLKHHLKELNAEIDKHTPKTVHISSESTKTHKPEAVNPPEKQPKIKKNARTKK